MVLSHFRFIWMLTLASSFFLPSAATCMQWGPAGHDGTVYLLATREFGFTREAAQILSLGAIAPDYFQFNSDAAHGQTPVGWSKEDALKATLELHEKIKRNADFALEHREYEKALFLYGYALHPLMDLPFHRLMSAYDHSVLNETPFDIDDPLENLRSLEQSNGIVARFLANLLATKEGQDLRNFSGPTRLRVADWNPMSGKSLTIQALGKEILPSKAEKYLKALEIPQVRLLDENSPTIGSYLGRPDLRVFDVSDFITAAVFQFPQAGKNASDYVKQQEINKWIQSKENPFETRRVLVIDEHVLPDSFKDIPQNGENPKNPGGILLNGAARALFQMEGIESVSYRPDTEEIIFVGRRMSKTTPVNPELWFTALKAADSAANPAVSIDSTSDPTSLEVSYFGPTRDTLMGFVMYESDRLLKTISLGVDNFSREPLPVEPEHLPQLYGVKDDVLEAVNCGQSISRFWITPDEIVLKMTPDDHTITFAKATMRVNSELIDPSLERLDAGRFGCLYIAQENEYFATQLTNNYDGLAKRWTVLEELREAAKMVQVANWIKKYRIPVDRTWLSINTKGIPTPQYIPALLLQRVSYHRPWVIDWRIRGGIDLSASESPQGPNQRGRLRRIHDQQAGALLETALSKRPRNKLRLVLTLILFPTIFSFALYITGRKGQIRRTIYATPDGSVRTSLGIERRKGWVSRTIYAAAAALLAEVLYLSVIPIHTERGWVFEWGQGNEYVAAAFKAGDYHLQQRESASYGGITPSLWSEAYYSSHGEYHLRFTNTCPFGGHLFINAIQHPEYLEPGQHLDFELGLGKYRFRFGQTGEEVEMTITGSGGEVQVSIPCRKPMSE